MSWATVLVVVLTSTRWAQDLVVPSPGGVQAADAEAQRRLSRQTASRMRKSPESMLPPPAVAESGGDDWAWMVRLVAAASVTLPASGVPVMRIRTRVVEEKRLRVARYWSFTADREWAGRTVNRLPLAANWKKPTLAAGRPARRSAFSSTKVCSPSKNPGGAIWKRLEEAVSLSLVTPIAA